MTISRDNSTRLVEAYIIARLRRSGALASARVQRGWLKGWESTIGLTRATGRRARFALTCMGVPVEMGRGQQAFDGVSVAGLPFQVKLKPTPGAVVLGVNDAATAILDGSAAGRPYILVTVDGVVSPDAIPAGGKGEIVAPTVRGIRIYDLGPILRANPSPRTVEGRKHGEAVYFTVQRQGKYEYLRLNANLKAVAPIATFATVEGLAGWLATDGAAMVDWKRQVKVLGTAHIAGQPVTVRDDQTVTVNGKAWVAVDTDATHFLGRVIAAKGAPVPYGAERVKWLQRDLSKVGLRLVNHPKEGYTLARV